MDVRTWIEYELRNSGASEFDFWHKCWFQTYGKPCRSNQVINDLAKWRKHKFVPAYVFSAFERLVRSYRVLPSQAVKTNRWEGAYHRGVKTDALKLVDDSPVLYPTRGADGIWRCL